MIGKFENMSDLRFMFLDQTQFSMTALGPSGAIRVMECSPYNQLDALVQFPGTQYIQTLYMRLNAPDYEQVADARWASFFVGLVSLQNLWIDMPSYDHSWAILDILSLDKLEYIFMQHHGYMCKHLSSITIIVDDNELKGNSSTGLRHYTRSFKVLLFRCLEMRWNAGYPIRFLQLNYRHTKFSPFVQSQFQHPDLALLELESWRPELEKYIDEVVLSLDDSVLSVTRWKEFPTHLNERTDEVHWPRWQ